MRWTRCGVSWLTTRTPRCGSRRQERYCLCDAEAEHGRGQGCCAVAGATRRVRRVRPITCSGARDGWAIVGNGFGKRTDIRRRGGPAAGTLSAAAADRLAADRACDRHACTIPTRIVARRGSRESAAADSHFSAAPCSRTVALLGFLAVSIVHTTVSVCPGDAAR